MKLHAAMIIDDSKADRYILKRLLSQTGLVDTIHEADNGQSALDFLNPYEEKSTLYPNKFPPNIIFLDINMPLMDGFTFLEKYSKLRIENKNYLSAILMMFTSSEQSEDREKALSFDFVKGYIKKDPNLKSIPVIILTTSDAVQDKSQSFKLGVSGYFVKPFDNSAFVKSIDAIYNYWSICELPK